MSASRAGVAAAPVNGLIYAVGGRTTSGAFSAPETMATLEVYNSETDEWTSAGEMPISRCEAGIAVL